MILLHFIIKSNRKGNIFLNFKRVYMGYLVGVARCSKALVSEPTATGHPEPGAVSSRRPVADRLRPRSQVTEAAARPANEPGRAAAIHQHYL